MPDATPKESADHEAGHLVVGHFFGWKNLHPLYVTIERWGTGDDTMEGHVNFGFRGEWPPFQEYSVHLMGGLAAQSYGQVLEEHGEHLPKEELMRLLDAKIQDLRSGARGDIAIRRLHPEYNGEPDLHGIEEAVEIVMAQWPLITAVSKDLQDQETFFGMELHLVLAVHDPKIAQPRAGLDRYRNERKPAPPPPDWLGKGEWKEDPVEFFKRKQAELDALRREMDPDEGDDD